jgi:uncharacterized membrane protein YedE/YeeE
MRKMISFSAGLLFGLGLLASDMANPARVRAFLDLFGDWDPTLIFVMGGAMSVSAAAWLFARGRHAALFGGAMPGKPNPSIDRDLLLGSGMFGVGWGLVGICPGPSVVAIMYGRWEFLLFFGAMLVGFWLHNARILARVPQLISAQGR